MESSSTAPSGNLRILHVVTLVDDVSSYGGPLTVALNQCAELRARGHDARLLGGWRGAGAPPTELDGVPVHLFPVRNVVPGMRFSGLMSPAMLRWLSREAASFDVAHLHLARDLVPLAAAVQLHRAGVPYVTQTHGMVMPDRRLSARGLDSAVVRRVLRRARARFVLTTVERDGLAAVLGVEPFPAEGGRDLLTPLGNGITGRAAGGSTRELQPRQAASQASEQAATPLDVVFLARLHPRKRVLDFASAAITLTREGVNAQFTVLGPDDGDLPALQKLMEGDRGPAGLVYEGAVTHQEALVRLARADVYVLPSVDEPFPMTLLEAVGSGTPSICTNTCGLAEALGGPGGVLVVEQGVAGLTEGLRRLLGDSASRRRLAERGAEIVRQRFSMAGVGDQLLVHYGRATLSLPRRARESQDRAA